ncbi:MAG: TatD family hydrolase [Candidatus Altiarchaeota archaeon]
MEVIDAHCHADSRSLTDFRRLAEAGYKGIITLAMHKTEPRRAETLLDYWDVLLKNYSGELKDTGLTSYLGLGIHPRNAHFTGEKNYEVAYDALGGYLQKENVTALGEVGLDRIDKTEKEVLRRQLQIAKEIRKPAVIHTPGKRKSEALDETLKILKEVGFPPKLTVLDHTDLTTLDRVLAHGSMIGLSIKSDKLDIPTVIRILKEHPEAVDRFMLNTDFGYSASHFEELNGVRRAAEEIAAELGRSTAAKAASDNAIRFFKLGLPLELSDDIRKKGIGDIERGLRGGHKPRNRV